MLKRIFDIIFSVAGLLALGPLWLWIAWRIKREDGGPIFYRGMRIGRFGQPFPIFKFRTMVKDAEKLGASSTAADDERITRVGKFLRKHKWDELPQLINVLIGEMSLVGPRPEIKRYTDMFTDEEKLILSVKPGITDWASIWNADEGAVLKGAANVEKAYEELIRPTKLKLQLKYAQENSLWNDLKIVFLTILALCKPKCEGLREIGNFQSKNKLQIDRLDFFK